MYISVVIAPIGTELLLLCRAFGRDGDHHLAHHRFVGRIRRRDPHGDGRATLIDQQMDFTARPRAVGRVLARGLATEWCRTTAAVDRLPAPLDAARAVVKAQQRLQHLGEAPFLFPELEAVVDDRAADAKPRAMDGFPLAARPQYIPDTIDNRACISGRTPWPTARNGFGQ